ncbi:armadillo-type protein [Myxozyma melibiosi]|uniref:Armadillo-type protein n=1 Tax=Myxozyma melibiosi TaxID=54550 RepID=A0ABR1F910_9ASCO
MVSQTEYELIEQKVKQLYLPGSPDSINQLQRELQSLQRSPAAWDLANLMLSSPDQNVRFFGALTYTVKINNDWHSIPTTSVHQLLSQLLNWIILHRSGPRFITQKLIATLVLALIKFPSDASTIWPYPIHDFILSLSQLSVVINTRSTDADLNLQSETDFAVLIASFSRENLDTSLLFCSTFAEEMLRADVPRQDRPLLQKLLADSTQHALPIMTTLICTTPSELAPDLYPVLTSSFKCYRAWALSLATSSGMSPELSSVAAIFPRVVAFLELESDDTVFSTVSEVMIDFMEWSDKLVTAQSMNTLLHLFAGPWSASKIQQIVADPDSAEDGINLYFLNAFISFGELTARDISGSLSLSESQRILELTLALVKVAGYPIEDETVSKRTLEFWDLFVESVLYDDDGVLQQAGDSAASASKEKAAQATTIMMTVIESLWHKIRLPPTNIFSHWSQDTRDQFFAFRKDVADLIESSYQLVQPKLYSVLVDFVIQSTSSGTPDAVDWPGVEASLYALNAISQSLTSSPVEYETLKILLDSNLFHLLPQSPMLRAKQTSLNLISSVIPYFQSDPGKTYIPVVVPYLFQCLATSSLALHASRSIFQLCADCAPVLAPNVQDFLAIYRDMLVNGHDIDALAKERIAGAIAEVIVQGVEELERKVAYIGELVGILKVYAEQAVAAANSKVDQQQQEDSILPKDIAASALKSLAMVGKACREGEDLISTHTPEQKRAYAETLAQVWDAPGSRGRAIKDEILSVVVTLSQRVPDFAGEIAVRQNACAVLRAGFSERGPGPFTVSAEVIVGYVREEVARVGNLATMQPVIALVGGFVVANSDKESEDASSACAELLDVLYSGAVVPNTCASSALQDPDVNQGMLEVMQKYLARYTPVLFSSYCFEPLVGRFAVEMLTTREPLVVKAAVKFWTALINTKMRGADEAELVAVVDQVVQATGEVVMGKVVWAITGNAPRSLLTEYAQLVKAYFRLYTGLAQRWMSAGLAVEGEQQQEEKKRARRMFVEKIARLRGRPPTETIVKEFWLGERGQEVDFA